MLLLQQKKYMSKQICILIGKFFKVHSLSKEQNTLHKQRHSNCNCLLLSFEKQKCVSIYAFYLHRTASLSNQKKTNYDDGTERKGKGEAHSRWKKRKRMKIFFAKEKDKKNLRICVKQHVCASPVSNTYFFCEECG